MTHSKKQHHGKFGCCLTGRTHAPTTVSRPGTGRFWALRIREGVWQVKYESEIISQYESDEPSLAARMAMRDLTSRYRAYKRYANAGLPNMAYGCLKGRMS